MAGARVARATPAQQEPSPDALTSPSATTVEGAPGTAGPPPLCTSPRANGAWIVTRPSATATASSARVAPRASVAPACVTPLPHAVALLCVPPAPGAQNTAGSPSRNPSTGAGRPTIACPPATATPSQVAGPPAARVAPPSTSAAPADPAGRTPRTAAPPGLPPSTDRRSVAGPLPPTPLTGDWPPTWSCPVATARPPEAATAPPVPWSIPGRGVVAAPGAGSYPSKSRKPSYALSLTSSVQPTPS